MTGGMHPIDDHYTHARGMTARTRYLARQRERGRCIACSQPAATGYVRCAHHLEVRRERRVGESARVTARRRERFQTMMWLLMLERRVANGQPDVI